MNTAIEKICAMVAMISKKLIVILSNLPWEWTADYVNQTAIHLSKKNIVICFFWFEALSLKEHLLARKQLRLSYKIFPGVYGYESVHFLPFRRFHFLSQVNLYLNLIVVHLLSKWFEAKFHLQQKIVWIFDPRLTPLALLLKKRRYLLLYDCVDYWMGTSLDINEKRDITLWERRLLRISDVVVVNSHILESIHKKKSPNIALVPQGFRLDAFRQFIHVVAKGLPKRKPILGFIGGINHRLDFPLIRALAKKNPHCNFFLIGPLQKVTNKKIENFVHRELKRLLRHNNVYSFSSFSKKDIPSLIQSFDIGIIPYNTKLLWNRYSYPMKLFEYFYMGKPVIATPIEELKRFPKYVRIGSTVEEWERQIKDLLFRPWPQQHQEEQRRLAEENSWEKKVAAISQIVLSKDIYSKS